MIRKTLSDFGGPFVDYASVGDPTSEVGADFYNAQAECVAQMTRTAPKAIITFKTVTASGTTTASVVACYSQWGTGVSYYPTVTKLSTGAYTITFSSFYEDALEEVEDTAFVMAVGNCEPSGSSHGYIQAAASSYIVSVNVRDPGASNALSDLGGAKQVNVVVF